MEIELVTPLIHDLLPNDLAVEGLIALLESVGHTLDEGPKSGHKFVDLCIEIVTSTRS